MQLYTRGLRYLQHHVAATCLRGPGPVRILSRFVVLSIMTPTYMARMLSHVASFLLNTMCFCHIALLVLSGFRYNQQNLCVEIV